MGVFKSFHLKKTPNQTLRGGNKNAGQVWESVPGVTAQVCVQPSLASAACCDIQGHWLLGESDTPMQLLREGGERTFPTVSIPTLHSLLGGDLELFFCTDCHGSSLEFDNGKGPRCATLSWFSTPVYLLLSQQFQLLVFLVKNTAMT